MLGSHIRWVVFVLHAHMLLTPISPFPHNFGDRRTRRPVHYRLRSGVPQLKKNTHIVAYTTHRTCPTSSQCSPYPRNMASRPFSHYTRTSGCATRAGSAHQYRHHQLEILCAMCGRRAGSTCGHMSSVMSLRRAGIGKVTNFAQAGVCKGRSKNYITHSQE